MEAGTIVEKGTHNGLIAEGGAYSRLVRAQLLSDPEADNPPPGVTLN
jgi:hypothetical protein